MSSDDVLIRVFAPKDGPAVQVMVAKHLTNLQYVLPERIMRRADVQAALIGATAAACASYRSRPALTWVVLGAVAVPALAVGYMSYRVGAYLKGSMRTAIATGDLSDIDANYVHNPGCGFWVAELNGQVIGAVALRRHSDDEVQLLRMVVQNEFQGRGIARKLLSTAVREAQARGYKRLWLKTSGLQDRAIRLYSRHGFHVVNVSTEWSSLVPILTFEKDLSFA